MKTSLPVLRLLAYDRKPSLTYLAFDKKHDRARLLKVGVFPPELRTISSLASITDILVTKHEDIENQPSYGAVLRIRNDRPIRFGCASRDRAMEIMHKTAHYLGLRHRQSETAEPAPVLSR